MAKKAPESGGRGYPSSRMEGRRWTAWRRGYGTQKNAGHVHGGHEK